MRKNFMMPREWRVGVMFWRKPLCGVWDLQRDVWEA